MRVTGTVGPAGRRDAVAGAIHANCQCGVGLAGRAARFTGNRCSERDYAAFIGSVRPGACRRRTGQEAEPIAHDLRIRPVGEIGFRKLRDVFEQRVAGGVVAAGAAPGKRHEVVGEGHNSGRHVACEFFRVVDNVSFEINPRAFGGAGVGEDDDRSVGVHTAHMTLVDNGVVDHGVEVALLRVNGLVAIINEVADDGDFGGVTAVVPSADVAGGVGCAAVLV